MKYYRLDEVVNSNSFFDFYFTLPNFILIKKFFSESDEEIKAKTICGFTLVDCFDLARMPKFYFLPHVQNIVKKFGLFSCTGGQIRLHFSINRVAFVGGENIVIEGILLYKPRGTKIKKIQEK